VELDLGCVSDFLVLLEVGHYGRAAQRLHLSGSALSKRVQRLERQVGVPLLVRGPMGTLGPTAAGVRFAAAAAPVLAAARELQRSGPEMRRPPLPRSESAPAAPSVVAGSAQVPAARQPVGTPRAPTG
jgi:DNA-binding transcriptional LysR family regulator